LAVSRLERLHESGLGHQKALRAQQVAPAILNAFLSSLKQNFNNFLGNFLEIAKKYKKQRANSPLALVLFSRVDFY